MGGRIDTIKNAESGCDSRRYFITLKSSSRVATTHWGRRAKNRTWPKFREALLELSAIERENFLSTVELSMLGSMVFV